MINLRYHVVSLTAVFLALAIGVVMGTGFLNRATVSQLERRLDRVRQDIRDTEATNQQLSAEVRRGDATEGQLRALGPRLVGGQLRNVPVLVIAADGVEREVIDQLSGLLEDAGADRRGTVVVTEKLSPESGEDEALAEAAGVSGGNRLVVQAAVERVVAQALQQGTRVGANAPGSTPEVLTSLVDAGYLEYRDDGTRNDPTTFLRGGHLRYVVVSGPRAKVPDAGFLLPVVSQLAGEGPAPVVYTSAADPADPEPTPADAVAAVRDDNDLAQRVTTVDDVERFSGQLATVWSVADLEQEARGHFGIGKGASSELPGGS